MKWQCTDCGEVHRSNPSKCSSCGHTVLIQYRHADPQPYEPESSEKASMWPVFLLLGLLVAADYFFLHIFL